MNTKDLINDFLALGVRPDVAEQAASALSAALNAEPEGPVGMLRKTAEALGAIRSPSMSPGDIYERAAVALEWGDTWGGTFGRLPLGGGWHDYTIPNEIEKTNFVWKRVATEGTGNGGFYVPASPRTAAAKALFKWVRAQTTVPFYGGYWWELADGWGFQVMDEVAEKVRRVRDLGGRYPTSCAAGSLIDHRLGRLTGPRMWAFIGAVAPGVTWPENHPEVTRRLRAAQDRKAYVSALQSAAIRAGVTFIPG